MAPASIEAVPPVPEPGVPPLPMELRPPLPTAVEPPLPLRADTMGGIRTGAAAPATPTMLGTLGTKFGAATPPTFGKLSLGATGS